MKTLFTLLTLSFVSTSFAASIQSDEFIDCFEKAYNQRISEIKAEAEAQAQAQADKSGEEVELDTSFICDEFTAEDKDHLTDLYAEIRDGRVMYYSAESMGEYNVRFHYERLMYEFECYKNPSNIFSAWVKGFGSAIGATNRTNFDFVEEVFTIMLGQEMWTHNGSDKFSEHEFEYCKE